MKPNYPMVNPQEWKLWLILAPYFAGCALGLARADWPAKWLFVGMIALGCVLYMVRPDSPLRRLARRRSIQYVSDYGAFVRAQQCPARDVASLARLTDAGLFEAFRDYARATNTPWAPSTMFEGEFIDFVPGLPGGPHTAARHYVYSGAYPTPGAMQIQCDPETTEETLRDRVRWCALQKIDSRLRRPGMEQEHRAFMQSVGIDPRLPL